MPEPMTPRPPSASRRSASSSRRSRRRRRRRRCASDPPPAVGADRAGRSSAGALLTAVPTGDRDRGRWRRAPGADARPASDGDRAERRPAPTDGRRSSAIRPVGWRTAGRRAGRPRPRRRPSGAARAEGWRRCGGRRPDACASERSDGESLGVVGAMALGARRRRSEDALDADRCVQQYGLLAWERSVRWGARRAGGPGPTVRVAVSSWGSLLRGRRP